MSSSDPHAQANAHATSSLNHYHDAHFHSHSHSEFTEKNRQHWDSAAKTYDAEPWQKDMISRVTTFLQTHADSGWLGLPTKPTPDGRKVRVLDYACGPGTVTAALGARVDEYEGVDLSGGMVEAYNERFAGKKEEVEGFVARARQGDLLSGGKKKDEMLAGKEFFGFDMVVVGLGFHHFEDLPNATKVLAERVRPGGVFVIVDLVSHELEDDLKTIVAHAGFGFEKVKGLFEAEGLWDVEWQVMDGEVLIRGKSPRKVFVARGRKPESEDAQKL